MYNLKPRKTLLMKIVILYLMKKKIFKNLEKKGRQYINQPNNSFFLRLFSFLKLLSAGINVHYPVYINPNKRIQSGKNVRIRENCILSSHIFFDDNVIINENCVFMGNIKIGKFTVINKNTELIGNIEIGNYTSIARNVVLQGINHPMQYPSTSRPLYKELIKKELPKESKGPIIVGNDVWIATKAIILSGVTIGDGAVVGAGAIVTKNVEPFSVVAGNPAKHIKWRFSKNVREQLQQLKWWEWDYIDIIKKKKYFFTELEKYNDI